MSVRVLPLMQYIPAVSPKFRAPLHLAPLVEALERTELEPVHAFSSVPPRHMKTETLKHAIVRRLRANPHTRIAYVTYAASFALKKSREIRLLYQRAGGTVIEDANTLADWRTTDTGTDDGGLWATSVGGPITGEGFDLIVIDDPVKSRALAESGVEREKLIDWYRDTLSTREEPGASTILIGTRWTPGDLAGHLLTDGWEQINLPAINGKGEALCPDRYPVSALERIRSTLGEYGWQSLYMGRPFARGGRVFGDTNFFDELPATLNVKIGIDLAYSTRTHADRSVAVVLGEHEGVFYVLEVLRLQVEAPEFIRQLQRLQGQYGGAPISGYFGGTEKGVLDVMKTLGLEVDVKAATVDKFTRCQPVAAAWNGKKVLLPRQAPWLDTFVSELVAFTGVRDVHDDQVDALAGAYDTLFEDTQMPSWITAMESLIAHGGRWDWDTPLSAAPPQDPTRWKSTIWGSPSPERSPSVEITFNIHVPCSRGWRTEATGNPPRFANAERASWDSPDDKTTFSPAASDAFKLAVTNFRQQQPHEGDRR